MSYLLTRPTAVLLVGTPPSGTEALREVLTAGAASAVVAADGTDDALSILADRDDVGCVLVFEDDDGDGDEAASVPTTCRRLREARDDLPLVVAVDDLAAVAPSLGDLGDCRLLPADADDDVLRETVADAVGDFERRRRRRAESNMFDALLERGDTAIYAKDEAGRHLRVADVPHGVDPDEAVGKTDLEVWGDERPAMARRTYDDDLHVVESGDPIYGQTEHFEGPNEDEHWARTTKVPWTDEDGRVRGLVGISLDVTDHVERARLLEEERKRIDQFTSYVSHDLKTPLQVASGALELARESGDEDAFEKAAAALDRMEETVDDLGQLVTRTAGAQVDDEERSFGDGIGGSVATVRLAEVVADVWTVVGTDDASLEVAIPEATRIAAAAESLRPLVENLLKNAIDHGGPDVEIRVGLVGDDGFYVADDGPGIPAAERDDVFREGYTTADDGTGTGLSIVSDVAERNDWTLDVAESEAGGTRVEVTDCLLVTERPPDADPADPVAFAADESVGDVRVEGSAEYVESIDRWIVEGSGTDVYGDTEEFHLVRGDARPPVRIQGRIADLDEVDEYSKAGFTIRADGDPGAPFGYVGLTPGHGTEILRRDEPDGPVRSTQLDDPPAATDWYRIEYRDGTITCSISSTGSRFRPIAQFDLSLPDQVAVGLLVCSHDHRRSCVAQFEGVTATELTVPEE